MKIPLAVNIESRNGLPFSDSYILNGYVQSASGKMKVIKRPGLSTYHVFSAGTGQAAFEIAGIPYVIIGDVIYLGQAPWTSYSIPAITTANLPYDIVAQPPYIATAYAVIKSTAGMWTFDGVAVTKVTDVDYPAVTLPGLVFLDSTYYVKTPTGQIYGSALGNTTVWTALNFLTASDLAGKAVAIAKHLNYLLSFGASSLTFYYDAVNPAPGSPLGYAQNLTQAIGCATATSIAAVGDVLMFMAKTEEGRTIVALDGQSLLAANISTPSIDSILNLDSLVGVTAFTTAVSGRFFYLLTLPTTGVTLVYNLTEKHWTYWASGVTAAPVSVSLSLGADLRTVTGTLPSGTLLPGVSFQITGATNRIFNGLFSVLTSDGPTFTFTITYGSFWVTEAADFITTGLGEYLTVETIPAAGAVAGAITLAAYSTTYFSAIASTVSGLILDKTTGEVTQISPMAYKDSSGAIDFNIVTPNIASDETTKLVRIGSADVRGDKVLSTAYLRYTDNDYQNWSSYAVLNMVTDRSRAVRGGATRRRAYHFRHLADTSMRVEEVILNVKV
jgi:hypothetical protein